MREETNLVELMNARLSSEAAEVLRLVGSVAEKEGVRFYLVGGMVRDLLMGRQNTDLDIVIEGDAVKLAERLAQEVGGKSTFHPRFRTAKVKWARHVIDLVTARSETYAHPGALPKIHPADINTDLYRRDFTVNSMAIDLSSQDYGRLIDPFDGRKDISSGVIRILHDGSFIDDATRIWRAIRYEQRLGFTIEPHTLGLLRDNLDMLETVSRDRIRHELELVFEEAEPEKTLRRAVELGVLDDILPGIPVDQKLTEMYDEARRSCLPDTPSDELYLSLLLYRLDPGKIRDAISSLEMYKKQAAIIEDLAKLKDRRAKLSWPGLSAGEVYDELRDLKGNALTAALIADDSPEFRANILLYREKLSGTRTFLTGKDLKEMGIPSGPPVRKILSALFRARLDGQVDTREDEVEMVRKRYL